MVHFITVRMHQQTHQWSLYSGLTLRSYSPRQCGRTGVIMNAWESQNVTIPGQIFRYINYSLQRPLLTCTQNKVLV